MKKYRVIEDNYEDRYYIVPQECITRGSLRNTYNQYGQLNYNLRGIAYYINYWDGSNDRTVLMGNGKFENDLKLLDVNDTVAKEILCEMSESEQWEYNEQRRESGKYVFTAGRGTDWYEWVVEKASNYNVK